MINKVWGETRRAAVTKIKSRLFFMDATVKAAAFYGAEIWGWKRRNQVERIQSRYVKGSLGVAKNTPDYIWKLETGRHSLEIEARKRAEKFLGKIIEMEDSRWAKKCLQEEIRSIDEKNPTRWAKEFQEAMEKVGDGIILMKLREGTSRIPIEERLEELTRIAADQDVQESWSRVEKSSFCDYYKIIKKVVCTESYWQRDDLKAWQKETWTRWRCGSVAKEQKKGFQDDKCRVCKKEAETLQHTINCKEVRKELEPKDRRWWESWSTGSAEDGGRGKLLKLLEEPPQKEMCLMLAKIEKILEKHEISAYENAKSSKTKLLKAQLNGGTGERVENSGA